MFNIEAFKDIVQKKGFTMSSVAEHINVDYSTLYRKMTGVSDFVREEIISICAFLGLNPQERDAIFFSERLEETQER